MAGCQNHQPQGRGQPDQVRSTPRPPFPARDEERLVPGLMEDEGGRGLAGDEGIP